MAGGLTSQLRNSYAALGSNEEKHAEREDWMTEERRRQSHKRRDNGNSMRNCPSINKDITQKKRQDSQQTGEITQNRALR